MPATHDTTWIQRCFDLAVRGLGYVSPNPPVGAVLVYGENILGEGYHTRYGGPHAEVEAIRNVPAHLRHLIPEATLYVTLEPCCITGKTPPCTDLILSMGIRDVRVSATDPNPEVAGKGLAILRAAGIKVTEGILEEEGKRLIRSFATNILHHRPHITLKWAQSRMGYSGKEGEQIWFSHPHTQAWTHRQRSEVDAIMAGARTIATDNPSLTTRHFPGRSPDRVIYDPNGRLNEEYAVFYDDGVRIFYFSEKINPQITSGHIIRYTIDGSENTLENMMKELFAHTIGHLLVEGGTHLHSMFIKRNLWDEAWVVQTGHPLGEGIPAPVVRGRKLEVIQSGPDTITGIKRCSDL